MPSINTSCKQQITSKLVWDCNQTLMQLARHNRVQLIWVLEHEGIVGNEMADQLARTGSEHLFIGPEPAGDISIGVAKKEAGDWINRNHKKILGIRNQTQTGKRT
jgi:ribonuclease HI